MGWNDPKPCKQCGKIFTPLGPTQKFCDVNCNRVFYGSSGDYAILRRDKFRCVYCGKSSIEDFEKLSIDHIDPVSRGGGDVAENLVTACSHCNSSKGSSALDDETKDRLQREVRLRNELNGIVNNGIIRIRSSSDTRRRKA